MHALAYLLPTAALTGMVTAAPRPQDGCSGLNGEALEECLVEGLKGPTNIDVSDKAVNFGDVHPSEVFKKLLDHCTTAGCSGGNTYTSGTTVIVNDWTHPDPLEVTVSAEAVFKPGTDATRETLVDILRIVADEGTETREETWVDTMIVEKKITQYYLSEEIHINTNHNGEDAHLNVYVTVGPTDSDFCPKILGAAGAIGGAITAGPGTAFGLAALVCN